MIFTKLFATFMTVSLFFMFCGDDAPPETVTKQDTNSEVTTESNPDMDIWARENLTLQALEPLLKESNDIADFERRLNSNNGVNNLDLNGDGYVDYISVREYGNDNYNDGRGLSLFTRFGGPNEIQEIANLIFNRNPDNRRETRVYLNGNEQIYGRNYNYGGSWQDRSLAIADFVFDDGRDDYYRSNYYYDNYPDYYEPYPVVRTPVYRERVTKYMVNPAMTKITTPTMKIKIKSPYAGRSYRRIYARLAEPTEDQRIFIKNNPKPPKFKNKGKDFDDRRGMTKTAAPNGKEKNKGHNSDKPGKPDKATVSEKRNDNPGAKKNNGKAASAKPDKPPKANKPQAKPKSKAKSNGGGGKGRNKGNKGGKKGKN
jgi:hypothetical protein